MQYHTHAPYLKKKKRFGLTMISKNTRNYETQNRADKPSKKKKQLVKQTKARLKKKT